MSETCKCGTKFCKHNKAQVWSCSGGTQSCAIAALIVQGKLPKPDFSVIADTGYETGATWEFMDRVLVPELAKVGVELKRIGVNGFSRHPMRVTFTDHKDQVQHLMPVISTETGYPVPLANRCTHVWKIEVVDKWLSRIQDVTKSKICRWIGFSRDEQRRWAKWMDNDEYKSKGIRFPLLEQGLTRRDCIALVESIGWGTPPRSSCYMCPNHSDHEWRKLIAERPDEFQKAVELEREIHKVDPDAWLHRSCIPLDQVDFSQPEDLFSRPCDSGMCFV